MLLEFYPHCMILHMRQNSKLGTWLPWLGVLFIALLAIQPLWGRPPYGDDIRLHLFRIPLLTTMWQEGVFFTRWQPTLNFGYGSPLFNFYPPLSAYVLTSLYWLMGQNAPVALNSLFALALLLGTIGMFLLGRHLYGAAGGLLTAALYSWAPHLVFQTYFRGSSSNALAMAFFPLAAWALIRAVQRPALSRILLTALFIALIMLSHIAASLLFLGPLFLLGLTAIIQPNLNWQTAKPQLIALVAAVLLGLGLSAFSWLPALAEIQYTRYNIEASKVDYQDGFADILRWPDPTIAGAHNSALPKSAGFAQISLGLMGTGLALFSLWQGYKNRGLFPETGWLTAVSSLIGLATLFLAISGSAPIWAWVTPLQKLQFPWRLLDIAVFFLALAAGRILLAPLPKQHPTTSTRNWQWSLQVGVAIFGLTLAFANVIPYLYPPRIDLPTQPTLADVTAVQQYFGIFGLTGWGEYSNPAIQNWPTEPLFPGADERLPLTAKLVDAPVGITAVSGNPWQAIWQINLPEASKITLGVHDFPGWQAQLDGNPLPIEVDENGRIQLTLPAGEHTLTLAFKGTPIRGLANLFTLLSSIIFATGLVIARRKHRHQPSSPPPPQSPTRLLIGLVLLLATLLLLKIVWIDRLDNPLVIQERNGRVATFTPPSAGNFEGKIELVGSQQTANILTLLWQAQQSNLPRYQIQINIINPQGNLLQTIYRDTIGYTVTPNWQAGELIRDEFPLSLDLQTAASGYELSLSVLNVETGVLLSLVDGNGDTAVSLSRIKTPPPDATVPETIGTQFGTSIKLRHVEIPSQLAANTPLTVTLVWESLAPVSDDYTVFIHLLNRDGSLAEGQDGQPLNGRYPTSYWEAGEIVVDSRQWQPNLPPGNYQVQIGLYLLETGERVPVSGPYSNLGDRVILQEVELLP